MCTPPTNLKYLAFSQKGQSLIQTMVSIAIMGVFMMTMLSTQSMQTRENKALAEKMASNDFQQQLTRAFADGSVCTKLMTSAPPITFQSSDTEKTLSFTTIPISTAVNAPALAQANNPVSAIAPTLIAAGTNPFQLTNISGSAGMYSANFQVNFDQTKLVRSIRPATTLLTLRTTASGATQTITSCEAATGSKIVCDKTGSRYGPCGKYTFKFTAANCGGQLPDNTYTGSLSVASICDGFQTVQVLNADEAGGPGISMWACNPGDYPSGGPCGPYHMRAIYLK